MAHSAAKTDTQLATTALLSGLLPIAVVHACYALSIREEILPVCIPYLSGCTSISAAGRHGIAYVVFKVGMIPAALAMGAYWWMSRGWLSRLGRPDALAIRAMVALGITSAAFLILYTVFLGTKGDFYNLMRRYGVTVHLSFGVLAQILLTRELLSVAQMVLPRWVPRAKLVVVSVLLVLGLASIPLDAIVADKDRAVNAIEWTFAALMALFYVLTWRAVRTMAAPQSHIGG